MGVVREGPLYGCVDKVADMYLCYLQLILY